MPFNEGQLKAIYQRDASILVSAPAGSGKTKILVSRIVELLKEGYTIYDFLVLTFTEAAGNEMKQRLNEELNQLASSDIDQDLKKHLEKQILNLPHAYITNFHGFCNLLLTKYGYLVDVMPGFQINSDPTLLKKEVFLECIENWVQDDSYKEFFALYFPGYSFQSFENILLSIDNLSHSIDDFYHFVEEVKNTYYHSVTENLEEWPLYPYILKIFKDECIQAINKLIELQTYCEVNELNDFFERPEEQTDKQALLCTPFDSYYDYLTQRLTSLNQHIGYDSLYQLLNTKPDKSYNMNWKDIDENIKKTFNKMKADILSSYNKSLSSYLEEDIHHFIKKMNMSMDAIDILLQEGHILSSFQDTYQKKKKDLNQLDFSDLETYTHQLLEPQYGVIDILYTSLKEIMVDEYQDTNQIQESLLLKISQYKQPEIPLFMVGDMKQSIYRFRQADPQIFSYKYDHFSLDDNETKQTKTKRIDLVFNYRSSKVVLDSINYIFNQIMDKDIGGLEYYLDESARLNYDYLGREKDKESARQRFFQDQDLTTEVLIDIYDSSSNYDKEQYEAHMVAQKIIKLKNEMKLNNKPVDYKDMVVLMRSTVSFLTFKKVFDLYQIPNHIVLSQGLMNSNEIQNMITFLKAIDNPYDDVSLLSLLKQPYTFSYIDMETIAKVRIHHKDIPLYECLLLSDNEQIVSFLNTYQELKEFSSSHSPYDLVKKIYEVSDYQLFVSQLINGTQRKSNLDLFLEIIKQIQNDTPYLRDLLYVLDNSSDYAPALAVGGDDNKVEFMTIHKSKGLEFPIVFVCNMHKQFNTQDSKDRIIFDKLFGFTMKPRMYQANENYQDVICEYDILYRNMIARKQLEESINEEMRILYVALTRASQKLILTGVIKDINEIVTIQEKLLVNENPDIFHVENAQNILLYSRLRKTNNYLSWILASVLKHPTIIQQCKDINELRLNALKLEKYALANTGHLDSSEHAMFSLTLTNDQELEKFIPSYSKETTLIENNTRQLYDQFIYPFDIEKPESLAVTKLHDISDDHYLILTDEENTSSLSAADKGTLIHLIMSHLSFDKDNLDILIDDLYHEGLFDEEGLKILKDYQPQLQGFIESDYYQMISQASYIYKEKAFAYDDKEKDQVIHGIFDLVFIYQDQVYVLDYKTDRISNKNTDADLILKHQLQLDYYKKVLKEVYQQEIKAIVYYLHINKGLEF
ncbi:MAG: UvrD-helicase domain-containing protein [Coprobacillus sp.]